ncbi:sensor histidine kinase [Paenibacillus nasutitermitis]|uniref:Sensor histidine kinase YesM n=1 Tax=Paenibacillus nasutitermitis TaxID=1652958 RepID=A0A916YU48_9BACL|nr:histidine kinase [Paenibacillus nasutitermitis]GGD60342.1 sensor histidine kinase YesM [Paenibacillus nasutitermitis]
MKLVQLIRSRLHYKMIIIYSLLTLAPLIIVSATFYYNSKRILENNEDQSFKQTFSETSDKIDGVLKAFARQASDIGDNRLVYTLLRNAASPERYPLMPSEQSALEEGVEQMLQIELEDMQRSIGDFANSIHLYNKIGNHYSAGSNQDVQYYEAMNIMPFEKQGVPEWAFFVDHRRMICNMQLIDTVTGTHLGLLVIMLDTEKVKALFGTYPKSSFFITNANNVVMSTDDSEAIGQLLPMAKKSTTIMTERKSKGTDFKYISRIPISEASAGIRKLAVFSIVITLVSWIAVMVITHYVLRRITSPITTLSKLMRKVQKENYQLIENFGSHDEIALLCNSFNKMIMETRDLIQKVYKAELIQKEAQLTAIRTYFNPHFLHNTLEYISILAKSKEKIDLIPNLVKNLSSIFRFSIAPGEAFVSLEVEVKFAQIYLQIHQYRFEDRFEYHLDIPDHLKLVSVPKLILQPIIENAFIHGIDHIRHKGRIDIRAYESNFNLVIEVEDNGRLADGGMSGTKGMGSGLNSIESRIKLHYGDRFGLEKLQGAHGMIIRLQLPILMNDDEENSPGKEDDSR